MLITLKNKPILNKAIVTLIIISMMFSFFACILSHQTHAEAANPVIAIEAVQIVIWVLGLVGITFATAGQQYAASQQAYNDIPALQSWVTMMISNLDQNSGVWKMKMTAYAIYSLVDDVLPQVRAYFTKSKLSLDVPTNTYTYYDKIKYTTLTTFESAGQALTYGTYNALASDAVSVTVNNVSYNYTIEKDLSDGRNNYYLRLNGSSVMSTGTLNMRNDYSVCGGYLSNFNTFVSIKYGFRYSLINNIGYLIPFFAYSWTDKSGVLHSEVNAYDSMNLNQCIPIVEGQSIADTSQLPYSREINYSDNEFDNAMKKVADSRPANGNLSIPIDDPNWDATHGKTQAEGAETATDAKTSWAQIWDAIGIKQLVETLQLELADNQYKPKPGAMPTIGATWGYVGDFVGAALIWMQLWFTGFMMLPVALRTTLWALIIIGIATGLLGVFLR